MISDIIQGIGNIVGGILILIVALILALGISKFFELFMNGKL